jgi:predicted acyl esterase
VIAALNSPRYEKNYNTGGVVARGSGRDARTARVALYHDPGHPSALELPIAAASKTVGR